MKYVQSFYQYPVTFSAIGKTIPARSAQGERRNIAEVTDKELERLMNCEPRFRELVDQKKYRVLNKVPLSYVPAAEQINKATSENERLRAELEAAKAKLAELESKNVKDADAEPVETPAEETEVKEEKPVKGKTSSKKNK